MRRQIEAKIKADLERQENDEEQKKQKRQWMEDLRGEAPGDRKLEHIQVFCFSS
jgi:hypothetical protein